MSQYESNRAAALKYDGSGAPVVVAAGSGYVAQKIVEVAESKDVPVYQDNSLATLLSQMKCGTEIPPELYQAVVNIYVYFLNYTERDVMSSSGSAASEDNEENHNNSEIGAE